MRMDGCEECGKLKTFNDLKIEHEDYVDAGVERGQGVSDEKLVKALKIRVKKEAIKWFKHFDTHPNPIQLGSCRTLSDFFNITKKDLKNV